MKNNFLLLFITITFSSFCQTNRKIYIADNETKKPIPFANVVYSNLSLKGTSSDIDGAFFVPSNVTELTISSVGYETKVIAFNTTTPKTIFLNPKISELDEVVLDGENPAHRIIKLATKNKDLNNPKNLKSYTYKAYDKIYLTSQNSTKSKDSILSKLDELFEGSHLFITETITKHKYL